MFTEAQERIFVESFGCFSLKDAKKIQFVSSAVISINSSTTREIVEANLCKQMNQLSSHFHWYDTKGHHNSLQTFGQAVSGVQLWFA